MKSLLTYSNIKDHPGFLILLLLIVHFNLLAQDDTLGTRPIRSIPKDDRTISTIPDKAYFKTWVTDARDIVIAPTRWNKYQWILFSGVTFGTVVLFTQDALIQQLAQENRSPG